MYTIGQFSKKTGVTVRTLRFYGEKGLLRPSFISESGRRYFKDEDVITLQKILTCKFLGYSLEDIGQLLEDEQYTIQRSLQQQRMEMLQKKAQIEKVIETLDYAIALSEKQEKIHTDIFLWLIHDLMKEDEQKEYLKTMLPTELVDDLYGFSKDQLVAYNRHYMDCVSELKEAYRNRMPDEEAVLILEKLFSFIPLELIERLIEASKSIDDDVQMDASLFYSIFTLEEEEWLASILSQLSLLKELKS